MSESATVHACIQWLCLHGCFVWRNNTGAYKHHETQRFIRYGLVGSADIIGVTPRGQFLAVECKSDKGRLTEQQERFAERVNAHGGMYLVAKSVDDLERCKEELTTGVW